MPKKRLIFTLVYSDGFFCQSRNFRLQRVGDIRWLQERYDFSRISHAVDELMVLNASRERRDPETFATIVRTLNASLFLPLSAGGWVRSVEDAHRLVQAGADKLVIGKHIYSSTNVAEDISRTFGRQACVAFVDYRGSASDARAYSDCGIRDRGPLSDVLQRVESVGFGDVVINSIDRDGTGTGLDLATLDLLETMTSNHVIASGGVGKGNQIADALDNAAVHGVATANLLNFIGSGLIEAREEISRTVELPKWIKTPPPATSAPSISAID